MAIITPAIGAVYLIWQIHKRDLRGWQHYACLTSLVFLISILFLVGSGKVESFGLAGNTVKVVDQKLEEIRTLTERNKLMAKTTVELVTRATSGSITDDSYDSKATHQSAVELLKSAGSSDLEIQRFFDGLSQPSAKTNAP
ncbi:MAG: hypothetical protein EPO07_18655 [Verrucomicrobia bacterium]|nr:MAG: hypothetical protein EPO07_18655 [Verrucomicrobiota bacterium]